MSKIICIHDKPLIEDVFNYDVIIIGTGIHNALGNGFQHDIKINFPQIEKVVKETPYADVRKLGTVSVVVHKNVHFCIGFIHKGGYTKHVNDYLDYDSLEKVLELIDSNFKGKKIATTIIGCSKFDGNGDKEKVLSIFQKLSGENEFFIYDYDQRDYREVNNEKWREITSLVGKIPYNELIKLKNEYKHKKKYGIY
jgi:hypothetical protein